MMIVTGIVGEYGDGIAALPLDRMVLIQRAKERQMPTSVPVILNKDPPLHLQN